MGLRGHSHKRVYHQGTRGYGDDRDNDDSS